MSIESLLAHSLTQAIITGPMVVPSTAIGVCEALYMHSTIAVPVLLIRHYLQILPVEWRAIERKGRIFDEPHYFAHAR